MMALAELARIETTLAQIAPWLDDQGHERAPCSAKMPGATCWPRPR